MIEYCENQVRQHVRNDSCTDTFSPQIECRRTSLLEYFGEHFDSQKCNATCDNCNNRDAGVIAEKMDVTDDCVAILKMGTRSVSLVLSILTRHSVRKLQEGCVSITLVQASQLFLGHITKGKERQKVEMESLEAFGRGKGRYERSEIERVMYHMILRQYLNEMVRENAVFPLENH